MLLGCCLTECNQGSYGRDCSENCGQCTNTSACDPVTGHCDRCLPGWLPPLCHRGTCCLVIHCSIVGVAWLNIIDGHSVIVRVAWLFTIASSFCDSTCCLVIHYGIVIL